MTTALGKPHIVKSGRLWECSGTFPLPATVRWWPKGPDNRITRHGVTPKHAYDCWLSATGGVG